MAKPRAATKSKDIDPAEVRLMASQNKAIFEIAKHFWCSRDTIERNFSLEVKEGHAIWEKATRNTLEALAAIHCTMVEMAAVTGVSVDTLERNYAGIIQKGKMVGKTSLRRHQYEQAQKGNSTMLIWLGKQLLEQKDVSRIELDKIPDEVFVAEVKRRLTLVPAS